MTEPTLAEIQANLAAEVAARKADPMFPAIEQLRTAACGLELVCLREPDETGTKKYAKWEKEQRAAGDYDFDAYNEFVETIPTTPHGAASAISVFLEHSLSCDAIECYPQVETFLKSLSAAFPLARQRMRDRLGEDRPRLPQGCGPERGCLGGYEGSPGTTFANSRCRVSFPKLKRAASCVHPAYSPP